ncbi:uncharacterized protein TNCV_3701381 [Trichonephila clavipes]|nr:uncharacterized protein TNCV_3701381 [Trichonephila clavipes]
MPYVQINNYKNALPAGRLIAIVSNYPNEIVTLDLLGPYPVSRVRRNRYVLVITDHFSNERLGIRHVKTVVYRPQANRTERVNHDLVQMIANYANEQHDTWDQFLREFAYAIRTGVNETTGKTPAELFLVIWKAGKRLTINADQVRIYRHRKCDETEIGTGSSDNGSLRDESSGFDRVQRRSNDSRDGKKKGSGGPEGKVQKGSEHRVNKRALSSNYRTNHSLTKFRKKNRREETVTPTTSGYDLRRRIGK